VLALAALKLGVGRAVGFDLDPIAAREARDWARQNGLASRFEVFAGPLAALHAAPFGLVLANLLRRELLPIVPELVECVSDGGSVVLSGLLAEEQERVESAFEPYSFETHGTRFMRDQTGDQWISLLMRRS
jgi:ribosomal protein L11 methyltransferase